MDRYSNLTELLAINRSAHAFYDELPDYVREMIRDRGDNLHTTAELQRYAEKLLRGDG